MKLKNAIALVGIMVLLANSGTFYLKLEKAGTIPRELDLYSETLLSALNLAVGIASLVAWRHMGSRNPLQNISRALVLALGLEFCADAVQVWVGINGVAAELAILAGVIPVALAIEYFRYRRISVSRFSTFRRWLEGHQKIGFRPTNRK